MVFILTAYDVDTGHTEVVAVGSTRQAAMEQAVTHLCEVYAGYEVVENVVALIFDEEREREDGRGKLQYDSICNLSTDTEHPVPVCYTVSEWPITYEGD